MVSDKKALAVLALLLALVGIVYASHFHNGFHFDDMHTVAGNPYIRDLRNISKFFKDVRTFSVEPGNRVYRPVVSTSLAFDYWLGNGLEPFYFHLSTFLWFLLQLVLMYTLFRLVYEAARPDPRNRYVALFATAWYGLHPAMAETINYVIQRADLYNTLGTIAGILIYATAPRARRLGLYLLPVVLAILSKPPALIFPVLLFLYIWLFEEGASPVGLRRSAFRSVPALFVTAVLALFTAAMTPKEFHAGTQSAYAYRITQPLVALRYFRTFFLPGALTADTDLAPIPSIWKEGAWAGFVFLAALMGAIWFSAKRREWRPVAFGLSWFLLTLVPTSLYPLGEVENDHRMFFPFVGLALAASWPVALWLYHQVFLRRSVTIGLAMICSLELALLALGTVQRNVVWRTEESLWYDVTIKSPGNFRGFLNYGSAEINKGEFEKALVALEQADALRPNHGPAELNLGIVKWKLNRDEEAERHFRRAIAFRPDDVRGRYFYARFLLDRGRDKEGIHQLKLAAEVNFDYLNTAYLAMEVYAKRSEWENVRPLANYVLQQFPGEAMAKAYLLMAAQEGGRNPADPPMTRLETAETFLNLSALYYNMDRFAKSIEAAREALKRRPDYAEAYDNMAAAYRALENWDKAIEASRQALRIRPNGGSAMRNLALAQKQDKGSI